MSMDTHATVYDSIDEANASYTLENPPPGISLGNEQTALKKGDIIAHFNPWMGIWHVKRVVRAGLATKRGYNNTVHQSNIYYVRHDAVPIEGKTGISNSHYVGPVGFGETSTYALQKDGQFPWYKVDVDDPRAAAWIAEQDQLWVEHQEDVEAEKARKAGTPEAFENRMAARAQHARQMAKQADQLAAQFRGMADAIESETRGQWIK